MLLNLHEMKPDYSRYESTIRKYALKVKCDRRTQSDHSDYNTKETNEETNNIGNIQSTTKNITDRAKERVVRLGRPKKDIKDKNLREMKSDYSGYERTIRQSSMKVPLVRRTQSDYSGYNTRERNEEINNICNMQSTTKNFTDRAKDRIIKLGRPKKDKLSRFNYPVKYPLNIDYYRYVYVELDPNVKGWDVWEKSDQITRAIPSFFYRVCCNSGLLLSINDRASKLKLSENQMTVTGNGEYCMLRATYPVSRDCWYYEAKIISQSKYSNAKIGWSQSFATLEGACGFDKFSYSCCSLMGSVFHESYDNQYMLGGYSKVDVLGCLFMALVPDPKKITRKHLCQALFGKLCQSYKDTIIFYKNGVSYGDAYSDIYDGAYYPAVSLHKEIVVTVNFGPDFQYPPRDIDHWRPMSERQSDFAVEQTMSDLLYLTCHQDRINVVVNNPDKDHVRIY